MTAVTVFVVRNFGNAEIGQRVDYIYDASNRRVARLYVGIPNLSLERAVYDGIRVIEERQYTTGQLQRRYYHEDDSRLITVEEDADNDGVIDEANDNVYLPLLDDRGTLMGVMNKTGQIIEKLYYNSTGLVKSFTFNGIDFVETLDSNGNNIGRSLFIRSGWTGMYLEPFTQKYHALFRDYDPQHQRWLSEDPAGHADGMNLYFAYMNVNYVDILGDNVGESVMARYFSGDHLLYFTLGFTSAGMDAVVDIAGLPEAIVKFSYNMAGESFTYFFINNSEERYEKFNKAKKSAARLAKNREEIMQSIMAEIKEFSAKYAEGASEGKNRHWAWEMEGRIAFEVLSMFVGVGQVSAVAKAGKGVKYANALRLALKTKLALKFKGTRHSKYLDTVEDFMSAGAGCVTSFNKCFVAGTQVLTDHGLKNIEDIKVGDFVLSKDEITKKSDYKPVLQVFVVQHTELFVITYNDVNGDAYELKVSGEHPFWVSDKGWVSARQLAIADKLVITDDTVVNITNITIEKAATGKTFTTYNFEVADYHTYFVLQEGKKDGIFAVWVHNTTPCPKGKNFVNANRRGSQRAQHGYYIREKANPKNVRKVGVSSGKIRKSDGKSFRAEKQVQEQNSKAGFDKYESIIMNHIPKGTNARGKILDWENAHSLINIKTLDPRFHRRPWPKK